MKKKKPEVEVPAPVVGERSREQDRIALKRKVRYFYDLQRLRLQVGGRLLKRPDGVVIDLHKYDLSLLKHRADELEAVEKSALQDVDDHLATIPFYVSVLSDKKRYRGVGPTMAGVILSEFNIEREENASQMWSFAGLAPVKAFRCTDCHKIVEDGKHKVFKKFSKPGEEPVKEKAVVCTGTGVYETSKTMRPTKGDKLPYNAFLRTKMIGVLGPVMIKLGTDFFCKACDEKLSAYRPRKEDSVEEETEVKTWKHNEKSACSKAAAPIAIEEVRRVDTEWRKIYDGYKHRLSTDPKGAWRTAGHINAMAVRYMVKMLLLDIHTRWRTFLNLPVRPSYHEEKMGHTHARDMTTPTVSTRATIETAPSSVTRVTGQTTPTLSTRANQLTTPMVATRATPRTTPVPPARADRDTTPPRGARASLDAASRDPTRADDNFVDLEIEAEVRQQEM